MKKLKYILLIILPAILIGCYEDKGNYSYKEILQVEISGIDETYDVYIGENLSINPEVILKNGAGSDVEYLWKINGEVVSNAKILDIPINMKTAKNIYCDFTVENTHTGYKELVLFKLNVLSKFQSGWLILSELQDRSQLCYLREDEVFYQDIYYNLNGEYLDKGANKLKEHWLPWSAQLGQIFVSCTDGPNYSVELDGASLIKAVYTKQEFVDGILPDSFHPENIDCVNGWDYLISNGKLYTRQVLSGTRATYQEGYFTPYPVSGDYHLSDFTMRGHIIFGTHIIGFEENSSSYVYIKNGGFDRFDYLNDKDKKFVPYDMNLDLLYGSTTATTSSRSDFMTVLKDKNTNEIHLHKFMFSGYGAGKYYSVKDTVIDFGGTFDINGSIAICQNRPYMYYTSGSKLYEFNYNSDSEENRPILLRDFVDKEIVKISVHTVDYNKLALALKTGENSCDFLIIDISREGQGKTLYEVKDKCGKVSDIIYKVGDQWRKYD